jgi:NAD(P)-dependent dehydrogenase (short-subunit alcohol dehydrogenase family)
MTTPTTDIFQRNLFKGKVAFVTGGGSGICRGITSALMQHGCDAAIISRTQSKLDEAARDLESKTGTRPIHKLPLCTSPFANPTHDFILYSQGGNACLWQVM